MFVKECGLKADSRIMRLYEAFGVPSASGEPKKVKSLGTASTRNLKRTGPSVSDG